MKLNKGVSARGLLAGPGWDSEEGGCVEGRVYHGDISSLLSNPGSSCDALSLSQEGWTKDGDNSSLLKVKVPCQPLA